MSGVSLVVNLSAHEYRALVAAANPRGVQAHVLVEQLVRHALATPSKPKPKPAPIPEPVTSPRPRPKFVPKPMPKRSRAMIRSERDEQFVTVLKLHGRGLNDAQIAAEMGIRPSMARERRVQLKLPALTHGRPKKTTTNAAPAAEKS